MTLPLDISERHATQQREDGDAAFGPNCLPAFGGGSCCWHTCEGGGCKTDIAGTLAKGANGAAAVGGDAS